MIIWDERYGVGIERFDAQHKHFFDILGRLTKDERGGTDAVHASINSLLHYVTQHFHDEETLMLAYQYPGYEDHIMAHGKLMEKTQQLYADMDAGNPASVEEVRLILTNWILEHIAEIDQGYVPFFQARGVR